MWKPFMNENNLYLLKIEELEEKYNFFITDLKDIWGVEYLNDDIFQIFQASNLIITTAKEDAVTQVLNMFKNLEKGDVVINQTDNKLNMSLKFLLEDTKVYIKFNICLVIYTDRDKFCEIITAPMIHTINFLEKQKKMLCNIIQQKDRQLEEYKMEKGSISRDDLITEKFDINTLNQKLNENFMLNIYGESETFWTKFIDAYGNVEANVTEVKVNPWNHLKKKKKVYNAGTSKKIKSVINYKSN